MLYSFSFQIIYSNSIANNQINKKQENVIRAKCFHFSTDYKLHSNDSAVV